MLTKRTLSFFNAAGSPLDQIDVTIISDTGDAVVVYSDVEGGNVASLSIDNGLLEFYVDEDQEFEPALVDYNQAYSCSISN